MIGYVKLYPSLECWPWRTIESTILVVDLTILIEIKILDVARFCIGLNFIAILTNITIYFFLALEDSCCFDRLQVSSVPSFQA